MHRTKLIRRIHPNFRELTLFCCSHGLLTCQESALVVIDETANFRKPTPLHLNKTANFGADLTGKPDWEIFTRCSLCTLQFRQPENTQLIHTESRSAFPSVLYMLSRVCCYFGHPAVAEQQPRAMFRVFFLILFLWDLTYTFCQLWCRLTRERGRCVYIGSQCHSVSGLWPLAPVLVQVLYE